MRGMALALSGLVAGCGLPIRDNEDDPVNKPVAQIQILRDDNPVSSVPRTAAVELSAESSIPAKGPLTVVWSIRELPDGGWTDLAGGAALPVESPASHTFSATRTFTDPFTGDIGAVGVSRWEVQAVVTDEATDGVDEATARLDVVNRAPDLQVRPLWVFAPGGQSWLDEPQPFRVSVPI